MKNDSKVLMKYENHKSKLIRILLHTVSIFGNLNDRVSCRGFHMQTVKYILREN